MKSKPTITIELEPASTECSRLEIVRVLHRIAEAFLGTEFKEKKLFSDSGKYIGKVTLS